MSARKALVAMVLGLASTAVGQTGPVPRVQVFPFTPVTAAGSDDWIGRGIQQSLQSDVTKTGASLVMTTVPDGVEPAAAAKANGAKLAVVGTFQVVGDTMRANGQLIDTTTGQSVGGFSATGPKADLFNLEDALGEQMKSLLPGAIPAGPPIDTTLTAPISDATPTVISTAAPATTYYVPATTNYYSNAYYAEPATPCYGYAYPGYGYGYGYGSPYYGGGLYFGTGFGYGGNYGYSGNRGGYNSYRSYRPNSYFNYNAPHANVLGRPFNGNGGLRPNPNFRSPIYHGPSFTPAGGGRSFGGGGLHLGGGGAGPRR